MGDMIFKKTDKESQTRRILIFELNWLGDILFSFPLIRSIRGAYPEAYIACAVVPRYKDLFANVPWIDKVYLLSDKRGLFSFFEKVSFIHSIKSDRFDMALFLKPSNTKAFMAFAAGIPERTGFTGKDKYLTGTVDTPDLGEHRSDQIHSLAEGINVPVKGNTYEYFLSENDLAKADSVLRKKLQGAGRIVALNPGGNWDAKRWLAENYVLLAKKY